MYPSFLCYSSLVNFCSTWVSQTLFVAGDCFQTRSWLKTSSAIQPGYALVPTQCAEWAAGEGFLQAVTMAKALAVLNVPSFSTSNRNQE